MKHELSKERLEKIASWRETYGAGHNVMLPAEEAEAMAVALLAAHEQEPVAVVELSDFVTAAQLSGDEPRKKAVKELYEGALVVGRVLYAHPAPELIAIVDRLNLSGYEHEDGEVTPQNAAAVVDILLQQLDEAAQGRDTHPAPSIPAAVPDAMLCDFYEVDNWQDLVRELVGHVEQLQDSMRRNVKPWEDTLPETLLPAYIERIKNADKAVRAAMLQSEPDGWITVSERLPDVGEIVLTAKDGCTNVGEMERSGANYRYFTSVASGRELPATHWQPLPAAPKGV